MILVLWLQNKRTNRSGLSLKTGLNLPQLLVLQTGSVRVEQEDDRAVNSQILDNKQFLTDLFRSDSTRIILNCPVKSGQELQARKPSAGSIANFIHQFLRVFSGNVLRFHVTVDL